MKIPKTFHQIWLGDQPMHPLMVAWRQRLIALHPDWRFAFWRERGDLTTLTCDHREIVSSHPELLGKACHLSQRSNIWRYEIMSRFGGVYLDTDIEPLKPFDDLLDGIEAFAFRMTRAPQISFSWQYASPILVPDLEYVSGMFGAVPGHPWVVELLAELGTCDAAKSLSMGTGYFTQVTRRHPEVTMMPNGAVLFAAPADWAEAKRERRMPEAVYRGGDPGLYAVHHWSSIWYPSGFAPLLR